MISKSEVFMIKDERILLRLPKELKTLVEQKANSLHVSVNDVIKFILSDYLSK